ncbi:SpaH/EbpB family LPXTG-anchored major pilin [Lapidilactobacillus bayanensis]|uniref:SpaH/EbpB family LPXTG-anchored major pilin n=1 Tax=Lapidilactobacillus bayanensis TaxID=2485998 RepID=UPI000F793702|nr:SpaH/EbpB family LPXTG-anchored major pilin [Lapidilactobacillus bayanensis]
MKKVGKKVWGVLVALLLMLPTMTGLVSTTQAHAASDNATIILHKKKMTTLPDPTIQNTGKEMSEFDQYDGLSDVEFKIYDVTAEYYAARAEGKSVEEAQAAVKDLTTGTAIDTQVTDSNGDLTFANLPKKSGDHDAVYVIAETPKDGVTSADNMVVAFPVYEMNADGTYTDNELDTIHLYPKNTVSVDGSMKLTKTGSDNQKLNGAEFEISKEEAGVTKYLSGVKDGLYVWSENEADAKQFVTGNTYGIGDNDFTEVTGNEGELIVNGLEVGDYKITETKAPEGAALIDGETVNDFTITEDNTSDKPVLVDVKNDTAPEITKKVEGHDYNIGDLIKYTITVKIPDGIANTEGDIYTKFNIVDSHNAALTYVQGATGESLTVNGQAIDFDVNPINDDGFTVIPNIDQLKKYAGKTLTFTYFMKLNDKADPDVDYENTAELDTDPDFDHKPTPPVDVVTGGKRFVKVDGASKDELAGAEFVVRDANSDTAKYLKIDPTTKEVTWVDSEADATTFTTGADGLVDVTGLDYGTYYLEETKAPTDYVKLTDRIEFEVAEGSYGKPGSLVDPKEVANTHKGTLPSTGGKGIIAFVVVGLVAIAGAIVYFARNKKHAEI